MLSCSKRKILFFGPGTFPLSWRGEKVGSRNGIHRSAAEDWLCVLLGEATKGARLL